VPIHNADIADIFDEIADLLEIEGANPFRVRAYRNAARTLRGLGTEVKPRSRRSWRPATPPCWTSCTGGCRPT